MNQKPYNKFLINFVCSVCVGKYLSSVFSHKPRSFVAWCVSKPQENTFSYKTRTRLICLWCFVYFCLDKPSIISFKSGPENNTVPVGGNVTIACKAKAFPPLNYTIYHNGVRLTDVVDGVKTIKSVNDNDGGRYECMAINTLGNVSASFNLIVQGKLILKPIIVLWFALFIKRQFKKI